MFLRKIINGTITSISKFSFFVVLMMFQDDGSTPYGFCGGSYLGNRTVMTASHCIIDAHSAKVAFNVHELDYYKTPLSPSVIRVDRMMTHPLYDPSSLSHDVAMLTLSTDPPDHVSPISIDLTRMDKYESVGTSLHIVGFGKTSQSDMETIHSFRLGMVQVLSSTQFPRLEIDSTMMIAGDPVLAEKHMSLMGRFTDTCQGDSGGPLFYIDERLQRYSLIGTTSWGYGCGLKQYPGVYSKLSASYEWIQQFLSDG